MTDHLIDALIVLAILGLGKFLWSAIKNYGD